MMLLRNASLLLILALLWPMQPALAQQEPPPGPVYIVQFGDTVWDIAARFGVSVDELLLVNGIADASQLQAGASLVIPGLEGIQGTLTTKTVAFGETLHSLSLRYGVPEDILTRLNHITSPVELYAGASLVIPESTEIPESSGRAVLTPGQSLLELAILRNSNPWTLLAQNSLENTYYALPGDVLCIPGAAEEGPGGLPPQITTIEITPLVQGKTTVVRITSSEPVALSGTLMEHRLNFFNDPSGAIIALQGVYALAEPGIYPFSLQGTLANGAPLAFVQSVLVSNGNYSYESLTVDPATLDPSVTQPENEQWMALASPATENKRWEGVFSAPVDTVFLQCITSWFGTRRSYNESDYIYFHTGLDYCNGAGSSVYAPAPGTVVFAGRLEVRGCAIMIDHGWGVYTAYMHLQDNKDTKECQDYGILVSENDSVETGQLIGITGGTGRVQGPHLHWEILVGGIQVDPEDWLLQSYP
ncbi:MAG: LysM peptidoglycan-binding domain-containing protein [Anaerolineales bacterium]|nr:LysM peptidoglycan-binding domain-containing protein [Anaerolineales bacterium]